MLNIDYDQYPLLKDAKYKETVMLPGDMLFIPRHHWHFIVSISHDEAIHWINNNNHNNNDNNNNDDDNHNNNDDDDNHNDDNDNHNDNDYSKNDNYSFSVSFWWGKRILKA